jgi:hypothetical protein
VKGIFISFFLVFISLKLFAQGFSQEPELFGQQVVQLLKSRQAQDGDKIASDFEMAWTSKFSADNQEGLISIVQLMQKKRYALQPSYLYLFSYLAKGVIKENFSASEVDKILEISLALVATQNKGQYERFLKGMNLFMGSGYLFRDNFLSAQSLNGSYNFDLIEVANVQSTAKLIAMQQNEIEVAADLITDEVSDKVDDWGTASDDDWGTTATDDWAVMEENSEDGKRNEFDDGQGASAGAFISSNDYAALEKAKYISPQLSGPIIQFDQTELVLSSLYDSLRMRGAKGSYLINDRVFIGTYGRIDWPKKGNKMDGIKVVLGEFNIHLDHGSFWTPNASLYFPLLFSDSIPGSFKSRLLRSAQQPQESKLEFTSHHADLKLTLAAGKGVYTGGIQIKGDQLIGTSISRSQGELLVSDGKGRKVIFRADKFVFMDSLITANKAFVVIIDGQDSIYHPSVSMEFQIDKNKIVVLREKAFDVTPFYSSYHGMLIGVDQFDWSLIGDSINFDITTASGLVPATIESNQYFNRSRYEGLSGIYDFHPIGLSVFYARKFGTIEFNEIALSAFYNLDNGMVKGAMKLLHIYGFAAYDAQTGNVRLLPRAFHYYNAAGNRKDYDNLFMSSKVSSGPNMTFDLNSRTLDVNGVKKFWLTPDYKTMIVPDSGKVSLMQGRALNFEGQVTLGVFEYKGRDFDFDYDNFLINLPKIDSLSVRIPNPDGTYTKIKNQLTEATGTLFINNPNNRSGLIYDEGYPYFVSEQEAKVYFNRPEILDGAYDSSIFFVVAPLEIHDLTSTSSDNLFFPGSFYSGGIFPSFEDTLRIMPDLSFGFIHEISEEGYHLYGTPAKTYNSISLSNLGLRGTGTIDFLNSHLFSEDFIYYPDSVTSLGSRGSIDPGLAGLGSFPQAEFGSFSMRWFPRKDSMYLNTMNEPFNFYDMSAQFDGTSIITAVGVYGYGQFFTRGSVVTSDKMTFKESNFQARESIFEVLSEVPETPAMIGENVAVDFDLNKNIANIKAEKSGVDALSFPSAAITTSISNAEWFLEDSIITMTKPESAALKDTYFYSTREALDSLAFNATNAIYDIKTDKLTIQGIPFIRVADAKLFPENNEMVVGGNSNLETLENAKLIFEYPGVFHQLKKGAIDIASRNEFSGRAIYLLADMAGDTNEIALSNFITEERKLDNDSTVYSSYAIGEITNKKLEIAPGFYYKGGVGFRAYKQKLELEGGFIQPILPSKPDHDVWINYSQKEDSASILIDITNNLDENGEPILAGIHINLRGEIYPGFIERRKGLADEDFFLAKGLLTYQQQTKEFIIEEPLKGTGERYEGHTLIYNDSIQTYYIEGKVNFINNELNKLKIDGAAVGTGNANTSEYTLDASLVLNLDLDPTIATLMAADFLDIIDRLGGDAANNFKVATLIKLANIIGDLSAKTYESENQKDYSPLVNASLLLNQFLMISEVKMKWNNEYNAWYNDSKIGISNIYMQDINSQVDGFLEFKKDDAGGDMMNLFLQVAPGSWYYFNYQDNSLLVYSSNSAFNAQIEASSNYGKAKFGEFILIAGEEEETLDFINEFRKIYLGINEPFNLTYPEGGFGDEEDDDGF